MILVSWITLKHLPSTCRLRVQVRHIGSLEGVIEDYRWSTNYTVSSGDTPT